MRSSTLLRRSGPPNGSREFAKLRTMTKISRFPSETAASTNWARGVLVGILQKSRVVFDDDRQSVYPAEVHARGAADGAGPRVAAVEAVLRSVGDRGRPCDGGKTAVLRRPGGVAARKRATGGAGRGGQLCRVDAQSAKQRQLHSAGVRGGATRSSATDRVATVGRDGARHDGVLRGSGAI